MVQNLKMLEEASRNKDLDAEANGSDEARRLGLRFRLRDGLLYYTSFERLCIPNAASVYEDRRMSISLFRWVMLFMTEQATSKFQAESVHIVQSFIITGLVPQLLLTVFHSNRWPTRKLQ